MRKLLVYAVRFAGEDVPRRIEVAYRGDEQESPSGSRAFSSEQELAEKIKEVGNSLGWELPDLPVHEMFADVSSGLGWDFHPSNYEATISLSNHREVVVYRKAINSAVPRARRSFC